MALNNTYDARLLQVQQETAVGAGAMLLLLTVLGTAIGMGPAGWLTGLAFAFATWAVLARALHRTRPRSFGPANRVTLGRATLVAGVTALVAESFQSPPPVTLLVALTAVALILDAVDGKVARRTGSSTALGARFDMEVDAFLILVLSVYVSTQLGPWVLLIGGMRYAFVAAARFMPWLNAALPPSTGRKTVAALQGVALLIAGAQILPYAATLATVVLALGSLVWSFGRDIGWLWRNREGGTTPRARETAEPVATEAYASASVSSSASAPSAASASSRVPVLAASSRATSSSRL
ncbi:CDP-alcohol phosphatidyltransferase family protein [Streptomyces sp. NBC_00286]|uniref:CDP-alcohol phosphatidyltransferase family protein n=1 Tax=Streptomyces sp. NBC_00286 TaxID=2975701 RepID=UPI002E28E342|nr:CDP-alcohol phosphatidyltransferase family protein [Streptomyces sp. NBC_00286]